MLPQSHVAYTWLTLSLAQEHLDVAPDADYRLIAIAAMGSDLIDKPLAWAHFYEKYKSAVLFAHTLIAYVTVVAVTIGQAAATLDLCGGLRRPRFPGPDLALPRYLLLAFPRLALSCLGQTRLRAGEDRQRLLVRLHPSTRALDLGSRRTACLRLVCLASQALSPAQSAQFHPDRSSRQRKKSATDKHR